MRRSLRWEAAYSRLICRGNDTRMESYGDMLLRALSTDFEPRELFRGLPQSEAHQRIEIGVGAEIILRGIHRGAGLGWFEAKVGER